MERLILILTDDLPRLFWPLAAKLSTRELQHPSQT
jgi:hypothetical protein